jgi:peptidylamidoglycolate lyase
VWITDVAMHQVFKFARDSACVGEPMLTLGERMVPGADDAHFCKPTDVAVASNGDFFVADGFDFIKVKIIFIININRYCNDRIMKFSADGKLLTTFGKSSPRDEVDPLGE